MGQLGDRPYSVTPTFDSRVVGEPYSLEIRENGRLLERSTMPDPFHNTTIRPRGWRVALAVLLRRYSVSVHVDANRQLIEDVLELDDNYRGIAGSKRRTESDAAFTQALGDFAEVIVRRCLACERELWWNIDQWRVF